MKKNPYELYKKIKDYQNKKPGMTFEDAYGFFKDNGLL